LKASFSMSGSKVNGFTYVAVLFVVAAMGIGLASVGLVWHTAAQRENETELLFVGEQFRQAIASYKDGTPGGVRQFPATLEDLVLDKRFPTVRRHLRKVFVDPMTKSKEWGLVKIGDGIIGVHSLSSERPLKRAGFRPEQEQFADAASYADWKFAYGPSTGAENSAQSAVSPPPLGVAAPSDTATPSPPMPGMPYSPASSPGEGARKP
jgi:type II secretory pathway pseudopilin PulG